jgi:hypothetical protein
VEEARDDKGNELNLDAPVFSRKVTLKLIDRFGGNEWTVEVFNPSVRGILQSIFDSYRSFEASDATHDEFFDHDMGDQIWFTGLSSCEGVWEVDLDL